MQEQSQFSIQLRKYIKMLITIWPSLRPGMRHITDITAPKEGSLVVNKKYNLMDQQTFMTTIINDMHLFIMQHDVKEQDLEDYLFDILDLFNIDEEVVSSNSQVGGARYMSRELMKVINELQQGKQQSIQKFETNIYNPVIQMGIGEAVQQGGQSSDEQDGQIQQESGQDEEGDWQEEDQMEQQQNEQNRKQKKKQPTQQELQKEKQLQDDGWVIVKKKS